MKEQLDYLLHSLRRAKLEVQSRSECIYNHKRRGNLAKYERRLKKTFPNYPDEMLLDSQFCAGVAIGDEEVGLCRGDR